MGSQPPSGTLGYIGSQENFELGPGVGRCVALRDDSCSTEGTWRSVSLGAVLSFRAGCNVPAKLNYPCPFILGPVFLLSPSAVL